MNTSYLIPNSTQIPDLILDRWMADLSGAEIKVVLYVARRTYGFRRDSDSISLMQMAKGITTKDGRQLDRGTGLNKDTVAKTVQALIDKGILIRTRHTDERGGDAPSTYSLNLSATFGTDGGGAKPAPTRVGKSDTPPDDQNPTKPDAPLSDFPTPPTGSNPTTPLSDFPTHNIQGGQTVGHTGNNNRQGKPARYAPDFVVVSDKNGDDTGRRGENIEAAHRFAPAPSPTTPAPSQATRGAASEQPSAQAARGPRPKLEFASDAPAPRRAEGNEDEVRDDLARQMAARVDGLAVADAARLVARHGADVCRRQLDYLPFRPPARNPAGFFIDCVKNDRPRDHSQEQAEEAARRAAHQREGVAREREREAKARAAKEDEEARLQGIYTALSPDQQAAVTKQAWERAIESLPPPMRVPLERARARMGQEPISDYVGGRLRAARAEILREIETEAAK